MNFHVHQPMRRPQPVAQPEPEPESEEEAMDADWIIAHKPDVKFVRAYFKEMVKGIEDD